MERISNVQPLVYKALVEQPETRTDDFLLVLAVFENFIPSHRSIGGALLNHKAYGLPSFASIIRIRRKLQKMHPELENISTAEMRETATGDYKKWNRSNKDVN